MFAPNLAGVAAAREEINQRVLAAEPVLITQKQATALGMVGLNPSDLNKFENCGKGNDSRDSKQMVVPGGTLKRLKRNRILPKKSTFGPHIRTSVSYNFKEITPQGSDLGVGRGIRLYRVRRVHSSRDLS